MYFPFWILLVGISYNTKSEGNEKKMWRFDLNQITDPQDAFQRQVKWLQQVPAVLLLRGQAIDFKGNRSNNERERNTGFVSLVLPTFLMKYFAYEVAKESAYTSLSTDYLTRDHFSYNNTYKILLALFKYNFTALIEVKLINPSN